MYSNIGIRPSDSCIWNTQPSPVQGDILSSIDFWIFCVLKVLLDVFLDVLLAFYSN